MARIDLRHYLIVFDHRAGRLMREPQEFTDAVEATDAYEAIEREYEDDQLIEVVLLGSDSLDTVRRTHANYFDGSAGLREYLASL